MPHEPPPPEEEQAESFAAEAVTYTGRRREGWRVTIAHEVNNPLSVIVANAAFLEEIVERLALERSDAVVADARVCLADLQEAADRIRAFVRSLGSIDDGGILTTEAAPCTLTPMRSRVLVIDDDTNICRALARMLRAYDVTAMSSPVDALTAIRAGSRYHAIVCDVVMTEMAAPALYEALERDAPDQVASMIFVTGGPTCEETAAFVERMRDRVVAKPFDSADIIARVDRLLTARQGSQPY